MNPQVPTEKTAELIDDFHTMREKALVYRSERDALQAKLDEANLLALSLQGQIVEMMAQPTEAWLIKYESRLCGGTIKIAHRHNAIADYLQFDPAATVTELIQRVSPM